MFGMAWLMYQGNPKIVFGIPPLTEASSSGRPYLSLVVSNLLRVWKLNMNPQDGKAVYVGSSLEIRFAKSSDPIEFKSVSPLLPLLEFAPTAVTICDPLL